jgi:hypothetical protein
MENHFFPLAGFPDGLHAERSSSEKSIRRQSGTRKGQQLDMIAPVLLVFEKIPKKDEIKRLEFQVIFFSGRAGSPCMNYRIVNCREKRLKTEGHLA